MKLKLTSLFLLILVSINSFSQKKTVIIEGKISSTDTISKANILIFNITKNIGALSDESGLFKMYVSANDTLYISSLQFEKSKVIVTKKNIEAKQLIINLVSSVNALDEVFLRKLSGDLTADISNRPKDTIPLPNFSFKLSDLDKKLINDEFEGGLRDPNAQDMTDPIGPIAAGVGLPDKRYQELLKLKREIIQKKQFPEILKHDLGIDYFTDTLKIPEEKINNFISFCEIRNILEKYFNNKQLEVIQILNEESKNYNAIKN